MNNKFQWMFKVADLPILYFSEKMDTLRCRIKQKSGLQVPQNGLTNSLDFFLSFFFNFFLVALYDDIQHFITLNLFCFVRMFIKILRMKLNDLQDTQLENETTTDDGNH